MLDFGRINFLSPTFTRYGGSFYAPMADELTPKQEAFCQKYIETGNASEAYRLSYDADNMLVKTVWEEASRTLADRKVSARLAELREEHRQRHGVTVDSITRELEEARMLAMEERQSAPMVSASMGKAKLHGLVTDKAQISGELDIRSTVSIYLPDNNRDKPLE